MVDFSFDAVINIAAGVFLGRFAYEVAASAVVAFLGKD
jgi:hypothetical protein